MSDPVEADAIAVLIERDGPHAGTEHELGLGLAVVGRGADTEVVLRDKDVSRRHAELRVEADAAFVRDLGSKNGVLLDDEVIDPDDDVEVGDGQRLTFGGVTLELVHEGARVRRALASAGEATRTRPRPREDLTEAPPPPPSLLIPLVAAAVFLGLAVVLVIYGS